MQTEERVVKRTKHHVGKIQRKDK